MPLQQSDRTDGEGLLPPGGQAGGPPAPSGLVAAPVPARGPVPSPATVVPPVALPVPARGESFGDGTSTSSSRGRSGGGVLALSVLVGLAIYFLMYPLGALFYIVGLEENLAFELSGAALALAGCAALGGWRQWVFRPAAIRAVFRRLAWLLVVTFALFAIELAGDLFDGTPLDPNWALNLLYLVGLMALVGLFEEGIFRGVLLQGLLARFGGTTRGVLVCVTIASLLFGAAHIEWGSLDLRDATQVAQACLKIAQTGVYGFALSGCVIECEEGGLLGLALFHGLDDFVTLLLSDALLSPMTETSYVSTDGSATMTIILYAVLIALYLPVAVKAARRLGRLKTYRGAFLPST
ncbi:CPBP family intramembrane glutamic endopeptidase [Olsenella massiliensis]|uniref:CPBP family intramembrane glutamic endopeptidase n=1 Tax=Olsenella massiliensis TaxID=1622075 RepID=UPI00071E6319|nr:CPBP family intramembrane glutamic endopeptidase [Olsenella massiliensis]